MDSRVVLGAISAIHEVIAALQPTVPSEVKTVWLPTGEPVSSLDELAAIEGKSYVAMANEVLSTRAYDLPIVKEAEAFFKVYSSDLPPKRHRRDGRTDLLQRPHRPTLREPGRKKRRKRRKTVANLIDNIAVKDARYVRTAAGERRFKQPIGSIIIADSKRPLSNLTVAPTSSFPGYAEINGADGVTYHVTDKPEDDGMYVAYDGDEGVAEDSTLDGVLRQLDRVAKPRSRTGVGSASKDAPPGHHVATDKERADMKALKLSIPPMHDPVYLVDGIDASSKEKLDASTGGYYGRGIDSKGRPQYYYTKEHFERQDLVKFARVKKLGGKPADQLDAAIKRDAGANAVAAITMIIRRTGMRPGSERNTGADKTAFGASTLQARHVQITPSGTVIFDFDSKKGGHTHLVIAGQPDFAAVMKKWKGTKTHRSALFPDVNEDDVNAYIKEHAGGDFKAKDLRTLHANVIAAEMLSKVGSRSRPKTKREFTALRNRVGDEVSKHLGNTRTLALSKYINPIVFDRFDPEKNSGN